MWVMAYLVWRKLLTARAALAFGFCLAVLGIIAFDSDAGTIVSVAQILSKGHVVIGVLVFLGVILLGGTQLAMDISDHTAMFWLARPLSRRQFVIGKFLGANIVGWILLAVFGLGFAAMLTARGLPPGGEYFEWLAADALRVMILVGLLTCLSTGMGYMPAAMIGGFLSLVGICTFALPFYCRLLGQSPVAWLLWLIYLVLPCWQHFDFGLEIDGSPAYWTMLVVYAVALSWMYLTMALIFFDNRDLS